MAIVFSLAALLAFSTPSSQAATQDNKQTTTLQIPQPIAPKQLASVPEPATFALLGLGLLTLAGSRRLRGFRLLS